MLWAWKGLYCCYYGALPLAAACQGICAPAEGLTLETSLHPLPLDSSFSAATAQPTGAWCFSTMEVVLTSQTLGWRHHRETVDLVVLTKQGTATDPPGVGCNEAGGNQGTAGAGA